MKVVISDKNSKLGKIPNVSLAPIDSCGYNLPCYKDCYAMKFYRMFPSVRRAWRGNLDAYLDDPLGFFQQVEEFLADREPEMFRWHVGGDIPDKNYLLLMLVVAGLRPETRFLAFTKRYTMVNDVGVCNIPRNLSIVFSGWPGLEFENPFNFPVAWMQDGTEDRIPKDAIHCSGQCDHCGMCWDLHRLGKDVYFTKH